MELIVIFGPPAVGKMTVGFALEKLTGFKLFHNHMVIELVHNFFEFDQGPFWNLVGEFRSRLFTEIAASSITGLIFTYVWALDQEPDRQEIEKYCQACGKRLDEVLFVELCASQATRLERNRSELRLRHKKTKTNLEQSSHHLIHADASYQLNSTADFPYSPRYIKINNEHLSPDQVAEVIRDYLQSAGSTCPGGESTQTRSSR